jgi:hypothetical protein
MSNSKSLLVITHRNVYCLYDGHGDRSQFCGVFATRESVKHTADSRPEAGLWWEYRQVTKAELEQLLEEELTQKEFEDWGDTPMTEGQVELKLSTEFTEGKIFNAESLTALYHKYGEEAIVDVMIQNQVLWLPYSPIIEAHLYNPEGTELLSESGGWPVIEVARKRVAGRVIGREKILHLSSSYGNGQESYIVVKEAKVAKF